MQKESIAERKEKYMEWGKLSCSICGAAIHNLPQGCTSVFCPTNEGDHSIDTTLSKIN